MPTLRDSTRTVELLAEAGIDGATCQSIDEFCQQLRAGAGVGILSEEDIVRDQQGRLAATIQDQPAWSDVPLVVISSDSTSTWTIREQFNCVPVERPVKMRTLLSAVKAALRSRHQQYVVRNYLEERNRTQANQAYIVKLADALRPVSTPLEVQATACQILGEHLHASRVAYYQIVGNEYVVERDYHNGVPSLAGRYAVESFGECLLQSLLSGQKVIETDATDVAGRTAEEADSFRSIQVRGHIDIPLRKSANFVGGLTVHMNVPRQWTAEEVTLVEETAERTWAAVERAHAERALRISEERFRTLFEAMDDGYCVVEPIWNEDGKAVDYRYLLANHALEHHTGLKDIIGKTARQVMPSHESYWIETYARTAQTGERVRRVDYVSDLKRWYDVSSFPVGPHQVGVLFSDVSTQRRAEERVRASEARLSEVFRHAPSFMAVLTGPELVFERVNERYKELIGNRDVIGLPVLQALPEIEGQGYFELLNQVYRTGQSHTGNEQRVTILRNGKMEDRILDFVYQPMLDESGAITGVLAQGVDITDRFRAQNALRERDERLQLAVAIAHMGTFEVDPHSGLVTMNEPGRQIYGLPTATTTFSQIRSQVLAEDLPEVMAQIHAALAHDGTGVFEVEQRILRPDHALRWLRVRGKAFFEGVGETRRAVLCVGAFLDITDLKTAEAELRDADRKKDDFIALLAHELRNPLAPIRNGLQVLKLSQHQDGLTVEMMDRQLTHMVRMIDDLLDISRIGRNKMELRLQRITLATAIAGAVETARPAIDAAGHELLVTLPPTPVYINADLTRLAQLFSNLLTNSAKYTHRGGKIQLSASVEGSKATIVVRDNGIGIPATALATIFDMFSQVDRSIERMSGGLGIGLALVKALTEMHGGSVRVESDSTGSAFTVELPVIEHETRAAADVTPLNQARVAALRVLVVDDNRDSADTLSRLLRILGQEVLTAYDGAQAVEMAEHFAPQLILMDVGMPVLNGYEATRRIREHDWGKSMHILVLSGWGQESDKRLSLAAGCNGHLIKPISMPDLQTILIELTQQLVST